MSRSQSSSIFSRLAAFAVAALFAAGLVSCGGGGSTPRTEGVTEASVMTQADSHLLAPSVTSTTFTAKVTSAPADKAVISGPVALEVEGSNLANVELLPAQGYTPKYAVFRISADKTTATASLDTTKLPDGNLTVRISAFNAPAGSSTAKEIVAMSTRTWTVRNNGGLEPLRLMSPKRRQTALRSRVRSG